MGAPVLSDEHGRPVRRVVAAFEHDHEASAVRDRLLDAGFPADAVRLGHDDDREAAADLLQRLESERSLAAPGMGVMTPSMARGSFQWAAIWGLVGALLALPLAAIPIGDVGLAARLALCALIGALAGSAAGFVFGGGRGPDRRHEAETARPTTTVAVLVRDPDERLRAVEILGSSTARVR